LMMHEGDSRSRERERERERYMRANGTPQAKSVRGIEGVGSWHARAKAA